MQQYKLSGSEDRLKKIGATKYDARTYSSLGYDDTTLINLKKIGIDLLNLAQLPSPWNEKIFTALSELHNHWHCLKNKNTLEGKPWFRTVGICSNRTVHQK